jgi:HAD superfamily hydrolase (TIGR01459 family)
VGSGISRIEGLRQLDGAYDAYIVDLWGCLHDGIQAYPEALVWMARVRDHGARVILLSNAPRRSSAVSRQLLRMGVAADAYDAVMTAGEAVRLEIEAAMDPWYAGLGRRFFHIGTEPDAALLDGLEFARVDVPGEADFVLCCGIRKPQEKLAEFEPMLARFLELGLPMVCANPDKSVLRGASRELCAGAIAERYAEMGGRMREEGKPYPGVYRHCLELLNDRPGARVLCIGDGLRTDILGAHEAGLDALWVTGGLPAHDWELPPEAMPDASLIDEACGRAGLRPVAAVPLLRW